MKQYHLSIGDHKVTKLLGGLEIKYYLRTAKMVE